MLDALLARWKSLPGQTSDSMRASEADRIVQARTILRRTVEGLVCSLPPADQTLFERLQATGDLHTWRTHFFDCFDLMARSRGVAVAVLRLHDLHRLLQDDEAAYAQSSPAARAHASV
jgi:hypothetical protein